MYTITVAYGIGKAPGESWKSFDPALIASSQAVQVFTLFRKLYLTLTNPMLAEPIIVDFEIFRFQWRNSLLTMQDVLADWGNDAMPTIPEYQEYEVASVKHSEANFSGYHLSVNEPGGGTGAPVHRSLAYELQVRHQNVDMAKVHKYCLFSVNGFFHKAEYANGAVYIPEGGRSKMRSRVNACSLTNFEDIGEISYIPITKDLVYRGDDIAPMSVRSYFDLSAVDLTDKTVMAVIGGYLYLPDQNIFRRTSDGIWTIDFSNVPIMERFIDSIEYLDLSSVNAMSFPANARQVSRLELLADEHFLEYLTLPQSFFVVVDSPRVFIQEHWARTTQIPNRYTMIQEPLWPLFTGNGRVAEYWKQLGFGVWVLNTYKSFYANYHHMSTTKAQAATATEQKLPYHRQWNSKVKFLEISADTPVKTPGSSAVVNTLPANPPPAGSTIIP